LYFKRFDEAEEAYRKMDRLDLAVALRSRLGEAAGGKGRGRGGAWRSATMRVPASDLDVASLYCRARQLPPPPFGIAPKLWSLSCRDGEDLHLLAATPPFCCGPRNPEMLDCALLARP
jgi:hypothetical protein